MNLAIDMHPGLQQQEPGKRRGSAYSRIPPDKPESEDLLVELYAPMVDYWVYRANADDRFRDLDDLRQDGYIGLLHAYRTYDLAKGANFRTWANEMVRLWVMHNGARNVDLNLANARLRDPDAYGRMRNMLSLDRFVEDWKGGEPPLFVDPGAEAEFDLVGQGFDDLVGRLDSGPRNDRLRYILDQYYLEERTLADIGRELGITRERVRQLLEDSYVILKARLSRKGLIRAVPSKKGNSD